MAHSEPDFDPDGPGGQGTLFGLDHRPETARLVVLPVPFEATTSYRRGTRNGPQAILDASCQVDLFDPVVGEPWRQGLAMLPFDPKISLWDRQAEQPALAVIAAAESSSSSSDIDLDHAVQQVDNCCEQVNEWVYRHVRSLLDNRKIPAILGGDHSVPFGAHRAVLERHPGLGILQVDAHADLRDSYEGFTWSHASIFHNVVRRLPNLGALVQVGLRDVGQREMALSAADHRITSWMDAAVAWEVANGEPWRRIAERIIDPLPDTVWISFDIDGLDPALCPHTGTPVPGGLSWHQAMGLLRVLVDSGRTIIGFDLCEVAPDPQDEWDAIVGARLLYKLAGFTLKSQDRSA